MNFILKYVLTTILGILSFFSIYLFTIKKYYKKGQLEEKQQQVNNNVKEALAIKKDTYANHDVPIATIRDRMRKYTRDR